MALRAVVVGGGIGGIAAAVALARAGIDVEVYEQAQQLAAPAEPVFSGVVAYRGLVPRVDRYPADAFRMWVGQSRHFLVFPVRAGQLLNYVGFVPSGTSVRGCGGTGRRASRRAHAARAPGGTARAAS